MTSQPTEQRSSALCNAVLIMVWASLSYRRHHASMTETARFLARLPLGILMALNLAYWGIRPFMSGF